MMKEIVFVGDVEDIDALIQVIERVLRLFETDDFSVIRGE